MEETTKGTMMCGECNWPLKLNNEDRDAFLEALKNPPELNDKFKEAFKKYHRTKIISEDPDNQKIADEMSDLVNYVVQLDEFRTV